MFSCLARSRTVFALPQAVRRVHVQKITQPHGVSSRTPHDPTYTIRIPSEYEVFKTWSPCRDPDQDDFELHTPVGINTTDLVHVARDALSIDEIPEVELAYEGTCNVALLLHYRASRLSVAARFPVKWQRHAIRVEPAVASMTFARHILGLPAPKVLAWNAASDNLLRVPYMLLEYIPDCDEAWTVLRQQEEATVLQELARCHANLAQPLPSHLQGVGQLGFSPNATDPSNVMSYVLRPLSFRGRIEADMTESVGTFHATTTSLPDLWMELWDFETNRVLDDSPRGLNLSAWLLSEDSAALETECDKTAFLAVSSSMRSYLHRALDVLKRNSQLGQSCLVNLDYALRNVLIDSKTRRLKTLVDWDDVYVMPFAISMDFPLDLLESTSEDDVPADSTFIREGCFASFPHDEYGEIKECDAFAPDAMKVSAYNHRVLETAARNVYRSAFAARDARVGDSKLWEARKPLLKAHQLLKAGGYEWWWHREWLRNELAQGGTGSN